MRHATPPPIPHAPRPKGSGTPAALLLAALLALLCAGCGQEGGGGDLLIGDGPDRSAAAYGLYLQGLVRDLTFDLGEGRTLRRLGFLDASAGRDRLAKRFGRLFARVVDLRVEALDLETLFDGARHTVRFTLHETGVLSGSMLDYEARFPVEWAFTARDGRLTLASDGVSRLARVAGTALAPERVPLPGVAVRLGDRTVGTTDDDGAFALLLPAGSAGKLAFARDGFQPLERPFRAETLETVLPPVELAPLEGFFPPPVSELRAEAGDGTVKLRFHMDRPVDRFLVLRRAEGPFQQIAELPPLATEYVDRKDLVNGRRYAYRVIPQVGQTASFGNPTASAVPSDEILRIEAEGLLADAVKLRVKGRRPYVVRSEGFFDDGYLAFHPFHTESLAFVPDASFRTGRYLVRAHVRRDERGGRFRLEISQHGDPDPEEIAAFEIDTQGRGAQRVTLDLGALAVRPVDWRTEPIPASRYALFVRSIPITDDPERRILVDALEFIRLP